MTTPASEFKFEGSNERAVGANGEINAVSKKDLLYKQVQIMAHAANGSILTEPQAAEDKSRQLTEEVLDDPEAINIVGDLLADVVYLTMNRNGFARKSLCRIALDRDMLPSARIRRRGATVVYATSATDIDTCLARDDRITPPEFNVTARPHIRRALEKHDGVSMSLNDAYVMSVEALMVAEDHLWYKLVRKAASITGNEQTIRRDELSAKAISNLCAPIARENLTASHLYMSGDVWTDAVANEDLHDMIDPVARIEKLLTGEVGVLFGKVMVTDGYRRPEHKVFTRGTLFAVAEPLSHGHYSDRGGVQGLVGAVDVGVQANWILNENMSMMLTEERSVSTLQIKG